MYTVGYPKTIRCRGAAWVKRYLAYARVGGDGATDGRRDHMYWLQTLWRSAMEHWYSWRDSASALLMRRRPAPLPLADPRPNSARPARSRNLNPIVWVLLLGLVHGCIYVAIVPPWQPPDENAHYEYLRGLLDTPSLFPPVVAISDTVYQQVSHSFRVFRWWEFTRSATPVVTPPNRSPVFLSRGGWSLYYRLSFPLYALSSTWPIVNQLYLLRLYSVMLQLLTVWFTYKLAQLIFTGYASRVATLVPLAAAFVVAVFPQYAFISASYNDDNLVPPLVAGSLYAVLKGFSSHKDYYWLGLASVLAFLAFLAKRTAVSLIVLLGLCLLVYAVRWLRTGNLARRIAGGLVIASAVAIGLSLVVLVADPPVLPSRLANVLAVGPDAWVTFASYIRRPAQLLNISWTGPLLFLSLSFWGWFGWLKVPLETHLMEVLRRVTLVLMAGCGLAWVRLGLAARAAPRLWFQFAALLALALGLVFSLMLLVAQFIIGPPVYSLTGRYLFPFISAFGILAVWGWQAWWPSRWKMQGILIGLALLCLVDFAAVALTMVPYFYS